MRKFKFSRKIFARRRSKETETESKPSLTCSFLCATSLFSIFVIVSLVHFSSVFYFHSLI
jgi:hypothetical protein